MMRPYQIYAVQQIVDCIEDGRGNGYVWHTTGSGKTLTSFKASTLLKTNPDLHKVLFVVDRKDLDRQTREEFNRFQENCVEENTNTAHAGRAAAQRRLRRQGHRHHDPEARPRPDEQASRTRSGGANARPPQPARTAPRRAGRRSSSTSATARSSGRRTRRSRTSSRGRRCSASPARPSSRRTAPPAPSRATRPRLKTTEDLFEKRLHAYTITHAIEDRNVLRFHVDYYKADGSTHAPARQRRREAGHRRGHPRQARRRDRRPPLQRALRHRQHQRRHRVPPPLRGGAGGARRGGPRRSCR